MRLSLSDFLQPLYSRISLLAYPHMVNLVVYLVLYSLSFIHSLFFPFLNILCLCLCLLFVFSFCSSVEPLLFTSFSYLFAFLLYNYLLNIIYISPLSFTLFISFSLSTSPYFSLIRSISLTLHLSHSFPLSHYLCLNPPVVFSLYPSLPLPLSPSFSPSFSPCLSLSLCVSSSLYPPSPPLSLFQHLPLPISPTLSLPPSFPLPLWYFSIPTPPTPPLYRSLSRSLSLSLSLSSFTLCFLFLMCN